MIERIKEIMNTKGMTPSQFADAIGIQRSGMSHILSGRNKPSLDFVLKVLERFPDIDPNWLLKGESTAEVRKMVKPKELTLFGEELETKTSNNPSSEPSQNLKSSQPSSLKEEEPLAHPSVSKRRNEEILAKNSTYRISKVIVLYEDGYYEILVNPQ